MANDKSDQHLPTWHPSLKKTFKRCDRWIERASRDNEPQRYFDNIENYLAASGPVSGKLWMELAWAGHVYAVQACAQVFTSKLCRLNPVWGGGQLGPHPRHRRWGHALFAHISC